MPFLPETLKSALAERQGENKRELLARRLRMFRQVLQTLAWLHQAGVTHRDIKPNNILIDHEGLPVLADFEIAKVPAKVSCPC